MARKSPLHRITAVPWYRKAAEQGEMVAQTNRGNAYYNGDGVPVDKSEAVKRYQKAAEQGEFHATDQSDPDGQDGRRRHG